MTIRVKCPGCNTVMDIFQDCACQRCGAPLYANGQSMIQIHRTSKFPGAAVPFSVYIDGAPLGFIGNGSSIKIPINAGPHHIHLTHGMNRRCNDLDINLAPGEIVCIMAILKVGFATNTVVLQPVPPSQMPNV